MYSFQDGAGSTWYNQVPRGIWGIAKVLKILLGFIMAVRKHFLKSDGHGCCKCSQALSHPLGPEPLSPDPSVAADQMALVPKSMLGSLGTRIP